MPPAGIRGPGYPARGSRGRLSCKQHNIYTLETIFKNVFVKSTRICTPTEHFFLITLRSRPILRRKKMLVCWFPCQSFFTVFSPVGRFDHYQPWLSGESDPDERRRQRARHVGGRFGQGCSTEGRGGEQAAVTV